LECIEEACERSAQEKAPFRSLRKISPRDVNKRPDKGLSGYYLARMGECKEGRKSTSDCSKQSGGS